MSQKNQMIEQNESEAAFRIIEDYELSSDALLDLAVGLANSCGCGNSGGSSR